MISQKPNYMDPKNPGNIRDFGRPSGSTALEYDATKVDRAFKLKSMSKRISTGKMLPRQRSAW